MVFLPLHSSEEFITHILARIPTHIETHARAHKHTQSHRDGGGGGGGGGRGDTVYCPAALTAVLESEPTLCQALVARDKGIDLSLDLTD